MIFTFLFDLENSSAGLVVFLVYQNTAMSVANKLGLKVRVSVLLDL